jgi:hypothetical protein
MWINYTDETKFCLFSTNYRPASPFCAPDVMDLKLSNRAVLAKKKIITVPSNLTRTMRFQRLAHSRLHGGLDIFKQGYRNTTIEGMVRLKTLPLVAVMQACT